MDSLQSCYAKRSLWWLPGSLVFMVVFLLLSDAFHDVALPMPEELWSLSWNRIFYLIVFSSFIYLLLKKCGSFKAAFGEGLSDGMILLSMMLGGIFIFSAIMGYDAIYYPLRESMPAWLASYIFSSVEQVTLAYPGWVIVLDVLGIVVVTAVWEEMLFRGILLFVLMKKLSFWPAAMISSILFGVMHSDIVGATLFGLALCYITWQTKSLLPAIIVHSVNNFIAISLSYAFPAMEDAPMLSAGAAIPLFVLSLLLMVYFVRQLSCHGKF
ncbi:type II CAAX endopeptidase family protein [Alkalimonas delamerensis]|uniref:Type II CAAX endopeptidase family protein n=1 Tax=Alkalimonas delamerensis TaxID=265981 RepID=A0ABT9GQG8_9GAMM|nr:type II CAAX endopeptidase family protein [Alkalimonas delamerensis]MDP4529223.1 type II CAAX endopeptidase family protein [Alkalimonas delamerensis]